MRLLLTIFFFCIVNILYCQNDSISIRGEKFQSDELAENRIKFKKQFRRKNSPGYSFNTMQNNIIISETNEKIVLNEQRKTYLLKKYGYTDGLRISQGRLWQGMTIEMVLDCQGIPYRINRDVTRGGTFERWIYSEVFLFFENGILTNIITILPPS